MRILTAVLVASLGLTAANFWTTLHRARRRLQKELAPLRPV